MSSVTAWTGRTTVHIVWDWTADCSRLVGLRRQRFCLQNCCVSDWRVFECRQNAVVWHGRRRPTTLSTNGTQLLYVIISAHVNDFSQYEIVRLEFICLHPSNRRTTRCCLPVSMRLWDLNSSVLIQVIAGQPGVVFQSSGTAAIKVCLALALPSTHAACPNRETCRACTVSTGKWWDAQITTALLHL